MPFSCSAALLTTRRGFVYHIVTPSAAGGLEQPLSEGGALIKNISELDDATVVKLSGRLDAVTAPQIKTELHELIAQGRVKLVLNLKDVIFLDSSGLGIMVSCLRRCVAGGGDICLSQVPEFARSVFELTRLTRVFRLVETDAEAAQAVAQNAAGQ